MATNVKAMCAMVKRELNRISSETPKIKMRALTEAEQQMVDRYREVSAEVHRLEHTLCEARIHNRLVGTAYGEARSERALDFEKLWIEIERLELDHTLGNIKVDQVRERLNQIIKALRPAELTEGTHEAN